MSGRQLRRRARVSASHQASSCGPSRRPAATGACDRPGVETARRHHRPALAGAMGSHPFRRLPVRCVRDEALQRRGCRCRPVGAPRSVAGRGRNARMRGELDVAAAPGQRQTIARAVPIPSCYVQRARVVTEQEIALLEALSGETGPMSSSSVCCPKPGTRSRETVALRRDPHSAVIFASLTTFPHF